jgi:hypothetical protein
MWFGGLNIICINPHDEKDDAWCKIKNSFTSFEAAFTGRFLFLLT